MTDDATPEFVIDIEVKLAYQERLIRDLDALVREFADRLDTMQRELTAMKETQRSGELPQGAANEPPPHY